MMRLLTIFILLALVGCKATQSVSSVLETSTEQRKDSLVYIERLRIDTVKLKGDSIKVKVPVPCDSLKPVAGKAKSGRVNLNYGIKNGQLEIDCNADSLLIELLGKDISIYKLEKQLDSTSKEKQQVVTVTNTVTKYRTPFWNWVIIIVLLAWIFRWQLYTLIKKLFVKLPI